MRVLQCVGTLRTIGECTKIVPSECDTLDIVNNGTEINTHKGNWRKGIVVTTNPTVGITIDLIVQVPSNVKGDTQLRTKIATRKWSRSRREIIRHSATDGTFLNQRNTAGQGNLRGERGIQGKNGHGN